MSELRVFVLGPFRAMWDGRALDTFRTSKVQALLIYLLVEAVEHPGHGVGRERSMTLLWPKLPKTSAQDNLRQSLYHLRKLIPEVAGATGVVPFILSNRQKIWINPHARYELDVATFTSLVKEGGREQLATAVDLYRGAFLADFYLEDSNEFEQWTANWRSRLQRQALGALGRLAAHSLDRRAVEQAAAYARRALAIDPIHESAHRQLMVALSRMGQRVEALRQYERYRALLREELSLAPSAEMQAIAAAIRRGDGGGPGRGRLPVPELPLIGRERELAELTQLLRGGARLVSIVGPGGMGKTRLALEVARHLAPDTESVSVPKETHSVHWVVFVNFAPLSATEEIVPAVARALKLEFERGGEVGLRRRLLDFLQGKDMLLVLDNFEHLIEDTSILKEILRAAPGVKLLVTSRRRLRLRAEHVYPLSGLPYSEWTTPVQAARDAAVKLFQQHARRVRPAFRLRSEHLEPLHEILELTEGMPLALILAAGWVNVFDPAEIAAELACGLDFLEATHRDVPPRQRSMRAVFEATWQRLDHRERALFAALSVFRGGFTLQAARAVSAATSGDLMRLIDRSLLTRLPGGRFDVHQLLRQFAGERLREGREADAVRDAHSAYYLSTMAAYLPQLTGRGQLEALDAIERDFENLRVAWRRASARGHWAYIAEASESLYLYGLFRSQHLAAIELFKTARRALGAATTGRERLAHAYVTAAVHSLSLRTELRDHALAGLHELESYVVTLTDPSAVAYCQLMLGQIQHAAGRNSEAIATLEAAHAYYQRAREIFYTAFTLRLLGWATYTGGRLEEAIDLMHHGLALVRQKDDRYITAALLRAVGGLTWLLEGATEAVESYYKEAAALRQEMGERVAYAKNLAELANIPVYREGDLAHARPLLEEALAIAEEQNAPSIRAHVETELNIHRLIEGDYEKVLAFTEQVLAPESVADTQAWARFQRGIAFLGLGNIDDATHCFKLSLAVMVERKWSGLLRSFLPFLGIILSHRNQHEWAAELLASGLTHPHTQGRLRVDPLIIRFRAELEETLGDEAFAAAWERGKELDPLAVAEEVLAVLERTEAAA